MFEIYFLDETNEQLEAFVEEMEANIRGDQTLAIPGLFVYKEDSEDHLDPEEETDQAGEQEEAEENFTGDQQPEDNDAQTQTPPQWRECHPGKPKRNWASKLIFIDLILIFQFQFDANFI